MKCLAAVLLCFCLLLSTFPASLVQSAPDSFVHHEFWGIPWGIPLEDFLTLSREDLGITFAPTQEMDYYGNIAYCADSSQPVSILGYPTVFIEADFSKKDLRLITLFVTFDYADIMPDTSYTLPMYLNLWNQLCSLYGMPTTLCFGPLYEDSDDSVPTEFPLQADQFDIARYREILEEYSGGEFIMEAQFGNVALDHVASHYNDGTPYYFIGISARYYGIEDSAPFPEASDEDIPVTFSPTTIRLGL